MAWKLVNSPSQSSSPQNYSGQMTTSNQESQPQQESNIQSVLRNTGRTASNLAAPLAYAANSAAGSAILGSDILGGLSNLGQSLGESFPILKKIAPGYHSENTEENFNAADYLPSTQNIKKVAGKVLPQGYLEPQTETEKAADDATSILASSLVPIWGTSTGVKQAAKLAGLGTLGGVAARSLNLGPIGEGATKLGFMMLGNTIGGQRTLTKAMDQGYQEAKEIGKDAFVEARPVLRNVEKLIDRANRGAVTPSNKLIIEQGNQLFDIADKNKYKFNVNDLVKFKEGLNELYDPKNSALNKALYDIKEPIMESLKSYGKENPVFQKAFFDTGEDIYKALRARGPVTKFLEDVTSKKSLLAHIPTWVVGGIMGKPGIAPAVSAGAYTGREIGKFYNFVTSSKSASNHYASLIKNAVNGNKEAAIRDINRLGKEADSYEKKNQPGKNGHWKVVSLGAQS